LLQQLLQPLAQAAGHVATQHNLTALTSDEGLWAFKECNQPLSGNPLTPHLCHACLQAKAREEAGTVLKVSPIAGVILSYGSTKLCVTFKPFSPDGGRGFAAQPLNPTQQVQPFDGLLQVSTSKTKVGRSAGVSCLLCLSHKAHSCNRSCQPPAGGKHGWCTSKGKL
jgi:hypothetical protein